MLDESTMTARHTMAPKEMISEAERLLGVLAQDGITARLLGGLAVAIRCPSARAPSPLTRTYSDYDIVIDRRSRRLLPGALKAAGFVGADRFNAMNGHSRQLYKSPEGIELDVFIERFSMCHELDLKDRLTVDEDTLTLADLVLTKLQVAELAGKDAADFAAIVLDHDLSCDDAGISHPRITSLTSSDWGWWRTITENLKKVTAYADRLHLEPIQVERVHASTRTLLGLIEGEPKSLRWKARAVIGERVTWREDPEAK